MEVVTNFKQVANDLNIKQKKYSKFVKHAMARWMTEVRMAAADEEIIPNTATYKGKKVLNPYLARKVQKSSPDRLTGRTGKLQYMLRGGRSGSKPHYTSTWSGLDSGLGKEHTTGLSGVVRLLTSKHLAAYSGVYRVDVKPDGVLTNTGTSRGILSMPTETKQTLFFRFKHELGIRGKQRPFISTAANKRKALLDQYIQEAVSNALKL